MMCKSNQSIFAACRDLIRKETGKVAMPNSEMYFILKKHGGCMNNHLTNKKEAIKIRTN